MKRKTSGQCSCGLWSNRLLLLVLTGAASFAGVAIRTATAKTTCAQVSGYTATADVDRGGDDIGHYGSVAQAAQACSADPTCQGFNSNGWVKRSMTPTTAYKGLCLYTKTQNVGCPSGWLPAVGTVYDSWPKPGSKECVQYSGCKWAGQFNNIDSGGDTKSSCINGAKWLDGGSGKYACRFPEATVKNWSIASTYQLDASLLNRKLEVIVQGKPSVTTNVNVLDVCNDADCGGCCKANTGNKKWKLIDIEKWPASSLLGFDPNAKNFDVNNVVLPSAGSSRPGAPGSSVMPLCYRDVGPARKVP